MKIKISFFNSGAVNSVKAGVKILAILTAFSLCQGCNKHDLPAASVSETPPTSTPTSALVPTVELTPGKIKPGVGIENIELGQEKKDVEKILGKPEAEDSNEFAPGQTYVLYYSKGIELSYNKDKLEVITLHSTDDSWSYYSGGTDNGLGVGSPSSQIVKALGEPTGQSTSRALRYSKLGLWFRLASDRSSSTDPPAETLQIIKPEQ